MSERYEKGHWTIRLPEQPCPHPDCWTTGTRLSEPQYPAPCGLFEDPGPVTIRHSVLRRVRVGEMVI